MCINNKYIITINTNITYHSRINTNRFAIMNHQISALSTGFQVTNGERQGGVLSPLLFNVYINYLSIRLSQTGIGGKFVNYIIYADDLCVISLSSSGLQSLLNTYTDYCQLRDITFITKKSVCMFLRSSVSKQCCLSVIFISDIMCEFANEV